MEEEKARRLDNDETSWRRRRERVSGEEKRASGETVAAVVRSSQRSKAHHLAVDRFVAHRFVAHAFVAYTFVVHIFVAHRFVTHRFVTRIFVAQSQSCFRIE